MTTPPGRLGTVLARLRALCADGAAGDGDEAAGGGDGAARLAGPDDELLGLRPTWVAYPADTDQVAAVLQYATASRFAVVVRGTGQRLDWGPAPNAVQLVLDTSRLTGVISHDPQRRTAVVRAGSRLDQMADSFAASGQRLALDPPGPATLGGALATGVDGPLRMRYGGTRELVAELVVVRGDGTVTRTGYDGLPELVAGGFGGLGVVTEATVTLHPTPELRRWVVRTVASPAEVRLFAGVLVRYPEVAAVEVHNPYGMGEGPDQLGVLVEGTRERLAERLPRLCAELAADREGIAVFPRPPSWWHRYPFGPGEIALRITTPASHLYSSSYIVRDAAGETPVRTRWSPGVAVMYAGLPGETDPARVARMLEGVRQTLIARDGTCVVLDAPPAVRAAVDMWGPLPDTAPLRNRKYERDPADILAPGRLPVA
ncbi:MAG: FAD-binding oxidoreductase [Micromonosporaceae bacterium]